jgi:hypothetical protein
VPLLVVEIRAIRGSEGLPPRILAGNSAISPGASISSAPIPFINA